MSCICVRHSHLTSITVLTAVWAQGWNPKHLCHYRASLHIRIRDIFGLCVDDATAVSRYCRFCKRFHDGETHRKRQGSHRKCSTRQRGRGDSSFRPCSPKSDARLMMTVVLAVLLDTHDLVAEAVWESSLEGAFRKFWREQGLRNRLLVLRETENIRISQDAEGPRHVTGEGFEDDRQRRKEQETAQVPTSQVRQGWSGHEIQRNERVHIKRERLGRDGMRRRGECRFECAADRSSVVAREKSRDSEWNRIACCSDCVRSFADEEP